MNDKEKQIQLPGSAIPHLGRFFGYSIISFEICLIIYCFILLIEDGRVGFNELSFMLGWIIIIIYAPINALLYAALCHLKIIPYGFMSKRITFVEILIFNILFFAGDYIDSSIGIRRLLVGTTVIVLILAILSRLIFRNYWNRRDEKIRKSIPEGFNPLKDRKYILRSIAQIILLLSLVVLCW